MSGQRKNIKQKIEAGGLRATGEACLKYSGHSEEEPVDPACQAGGISQASLVSVVPVMHAFKQRNDLVNCVSG